MISQTLALASLAASVAGQLNIDLNLGGGAIEAFNPDDPGLIPQSWDYLGCFESASTPPGTVYYPPSGVDLTAEFCTNACNPYAEFGIYPDLYAILFNNEVCLCEVSYPTTLNSLGCFQECSVPTIYTSCGATGKGVVYKYRITEEVVSHFIFALSAASLCARKVGITGARAV